MAQDINGLDDWTDELTENGILTDHPDVTMSELVDIHGEPRHDTGDTVVFEDTTGHEIHEWATALDMNGGDLVRAMHDIADRHDPDDGIGHWPVHDPVAFDARTFAGETTQQDT